MNTKDRSILFVCAGFGGGIGKILRFVMTQCLRDFNEVTLLHRGRESEKDIAPDGVKEITFPVSANNCSSMLKWRWQQIKYVRHIVKTTEPSIVCCFGSEMAVMVAMGMIGITKTKLVLAERGDPYTLPFIWKVLATLAFQTADYCVFQLEKQGKWYGNRVMKKSVVIPNPFISTGDINPFLGNRKKQIVSVGRFVYEKRYEVLIDAFKIVHNKHPEYKLVLYGEGNYRENYQRMINDYGLNNSVDMPGYTSNSMNDIKDSSVFVLSSLYEGMPNTLIEALAIGVPTVSTDCNPGGPDFLTDHGRRGLLVPLNDSKSMAEAILKIIETPELAFKLSELGKEIVPLLNEKKIGNIWLDFFNNILNKKNV